jgi:hypothetical protein
MHILTTSTSSQILKIVPRVSITTAEVVLTDKSERKNISYIDFASSTTDGIATITVQFTGSDQLVEGRYYSLIVRSRFDSSDIFYKGLVFCTDQTDYNKYETGKDDYVVESSYDNEFVII